MTRRILRNLRHIDFGVKPDSDCRVFAYLEEGPREIFSIGIVSTPLLYVYRAKSSFRYCRLSPTPREALSMYASDWGADLIYDSLDKSMNRLMAARRIPKLNPIRTVLCGDEYDIDPRDVVLVIPGISIIT